MNLTNNDFEILSINGSENNDCGAAEYYTDLRFTLIVISSIIAFCGAIANIILLYVLTNKKDNTQKPTLYPSTLAILDCLLCIVYILIFGIDAIIHYLHIYPLFIIYFKYVVPVFAISKIVQISMPYMLIFATIERLIWTFGKVENWILKKSQTERGRFWTISLTIFICIASRSMYFFNGKLDLFPNCPDIFRTKAVGGADWWSEDLIHIDLITFTTIQVFIPFFILIILNSIIIKRMADQVAKDTSAPAMNICKRLLAEQEARMSKRESVISGNSSKKKTLIRTHSITSSIRIDKKMRSAVLTMTAIVGSYLISNSLSLILTILERTDSDLLKDSNDKTLASTFHSTFSDIVSFTYMFTSAVRIVIYYICNPSIRNDLNEYFRTFCHNIKKDEKSTPVIL
uniref:G_PROTEIN_RECEP_F1_2 domain-containing protein n=1 Tax=Parastrongyloides trichosuri TaxID=131310 RepID=A0A0N4Z9W9_PARTI